MFSLNFSVARIRAELFYFLLILVPFKPDPYSQDACANTTFEHKDILNEERRRSSAGLPHSRCEHTARGIRRATIRWMAR